MPRLENISGSVIGNLSVHNIYCVRDKVIYWLCTCKCGSLVFMPASDLKSGEASSCGCSRARRKRSLLPTKVTYKSQPEEIDAIIE